MDIRNDTQQFSLPKENRTTRDILMTVYNSMREMIRSIKSLAICFRAIQPI